jgi:hypothetical protein
LGAAMNDRVARLGLRGHYPVARMKRSKIRKDSTEDVD